ncbi:alpha/beta fold hydrolase ['Paenibacillus yunnanensis' Narsing Rao et al. 2020]|uniref:alpha/beta fold hydrolase n=1 Tax=Paenibacillus tengchongensis TaxID=2608684 RepID=UPI00124E6365|nr:alpha/beta hydrolase [Paenibacillus tengchongensis]
MNESSGTVHCGGYKFNYYRRGSGIPVLVIGSSIYYPRLFPGERYAGCELIFLDHRGFVQPLQPDAPELKGLDPILEDMECARQQLGLQDMILMGHSGHAFMAMAYAQKYPQHVQKLVLLNTAPSNSRERQKQSAEAFERNASPERKNQFMQQMALLEEDIRREPGRRFAHMCIRAGAQSFFDYTFDAAHHWAGVQMNMPVIDFLWGEVFASLDLAASIRSCAKPVFLGLGRHDYLVGPLSLWDDFADGTCPHVRTAVFECSGHNPMFEEPDTFERELMDWLFPRQK